MTRVVAKAVPTPAISKMGGTGGGAFAKRPLHDSLTPDVVRHDSWRDRRRPAARGTEKDLALDP